MGYDTSTSYRYLILFFMSKSELHLNKAQQKSTTHEITSLLVSIILLQPVYFCCKWQQTQKMSLTINYHVYWVSTFSMLNQQNEKFIAIALTCIDFAYTNKTFRSHTFSLKFSICTGIILVEALCIIYIS